MSEDSEGPSADRPDCFQGAASPTLFRLPESTEGASLTPAEYRRIRHAGAGAGAVEETRFGVLEQKRQDSTSSSSGGSASVSEDSLGESRASRLNERLQPIHRILEDSRTRVSEESLCGQLAVERTTQCVIPNRLHAAKSDLCQEQEAPSRAARQSSYVNIVDGVPAKSDDRAERSKQAFSKVHAETEVTGGRAAPRSHVNQRARDVSSHEDKTNRYLKEQNASKSSCGNSVAKPTQGYPQGGGNAADRFDRGLQNAKDDPKSDIHLANLNVMAGQCKYRDLAQFTAQPRESNKLADCGSIPMIEFSRSRLASPATARRLTTNSLNVGLSNKEIQSPDYGVESDMKAESRDSFYDLIRENEDGIKFADDDDEYIDNRANL